ncbi:MAG: hypothetical protein MSS82_04425 [Bacteroidales bacterium]|nr:hypothetical protein [Bacteroidales bacterium]
MKRIIFLSIVTLFAISNYAQIEGFSEDEISLQQQDIPEVEEVEFDKSKILPPYKNQLYAGACDSRNQKLYSLDFYYEHIIPTSDQDNPHSVKPKKFILFMDSTKTTLGLKEYKAGEYYTVVDILFTKEEVTQLQEEMSLCQFIGDTVYYKEMSKTITDKPKKFISIDEIIEGIRGTNGKPKKFTITRKDLGSYPFKGIESLDSKQSYINKTEIIDPRDDFYYVLKKDNDSKYYYVRNNVWNYDGTIVNRKPSYHYVLGVFPTIDNFIAVTGFTQMKAKYEEKLLCKKTKYGVDTTQLFICKKIAPKDGVLQGLFENISTKDNTFSTISGHASFVTENLDHDTLSVLYTGHGGYCLKHEIDSILHRKEVLRQEKERKEKLETLAEQKRIIETYGETFGKLIIDGKVCVGMTKAMCIEALGNPCQKNSYTDKYDTTEVWTYYCYFVENGWMDNLMFVTFIDGKVTSITE